MDEPTTIDIDYSCLLVGRFLHAWALVEAHINDAIAAAIELDGIQESIVCSNIRLRDKFHILRCCVALMPVSKADRQKFDRILKDIQAFAQTNRNMMAHDLFGPSDNGSCVEFKQVKAKGRLSFPTDKWTKEKFIEKINEMIGFIDALTELKQALQDDRMKATLEKAFSSPTPTPLVLGLLGHPWPQTPEHADSDPAKPQTDDGMSP